VAFRGTRGSWQLFLEILSSVSFEDFDPSDPGARVVSYFADALRNMSTQFVPAIVGLVTSYPTYDVLFTGHSLGAALASMCSVSMTLAFQSSGLNPSIKLYSFGQPRVGNFDYSQLHDSLGMPSFRLIHNKDIVAHMPPCLEDDTGTCTQDPGTDAAYHHGTEVYYVSDPTSYKVCTGAPTDEDMSCSDDQFDLSISDHLNYLGVPISDLCPHAPEENMRLPPN